MQLASSQPRAHEPHHGQSDHGLAGLGLALVIATEAAVAAQPAEGPLHDPAAWQPFERREFGALDALARAAPQWATPRQQRSGVAASGPDLLAPSARHPGEAGREQLPGSGASLKVRGQRAPLAAGLGEMADRIEQLPASVAAPPPPLAGLGKTLGDQMPFGVRPVRVGTHPQLVRNCAQKHNDDNGKSRVPFSKQALKAVL